MTNATTLLDDFRSAYGSTWWQEATLFEIAYGLESLRGTLDDEIFDDLCSGVYNAYNKSTIISLDEVYAYLCQLDQDDLESVVYSFINKGEFNTLLGR